MLGAASPHEGAMQGWGAEGGVAVGRRKAVMPIRPSLAYIKAMPLTFIPFFCGAKLIISLFSIVILSMVPFIHCTVVYCKPLLHNTALAYTKQLFSIVLTDIRRYTLVFIIVKCLLAYTV